MKAKDLHYSWFFPDGVDIGELKCDSDKARPLPEYHVNRSKTLLSIIIRDIWSRSGYKIYANDGQLKGTRDKVLTKVVHNFRYWLEHECATESLINNRHNAVHMTVIKSGTIWNNLYQHYNLDFDQYYAGHGSGAYFSGRVFIQVESNIKSTLLESKLRRWLYNHMRFLINPLKDKFDSYFETTIKLWIDPHHYFELPLYRYKIADRIVPSITFNKDYQLDERIRQFSASRSVYEV